MVAFLAMTKAWISLVEGGEGLYLPNCQSNLIIALHALTLLVFYLHNHNSLPFSDFIYH